MEYKLQVSSSSSSSTTTSTSTPRSRSVSLASQGSLNNLVAGHTNSSSTDNHHQASKAKTEAGGGVSVTGEEKEGSKAKMEKGQQGNTNNNNNMIVVSDSSDTETTTVETKASKVAKAAGTGAKATTTGGPTSKASTTTTSSGVVVVPSSPPRSSVSRRSKSKTCRRVSDFTDDGTTKTSSSSSATTTTTTSGGGSKNNSHTTATAKKRKSRSRSHSKTNNNNSRHINHRAKHYVEHNYHDHKHDPIVVPTPLTVLEGAGVAAAAVKQQQQQGQQQKGNQKHQQHHHQHQHHHKGGVTTPFPERLHQLLEAVDDEDLMDIVGWQPHGRCFIVHKPKEFVDSVMPRFFKQSKLTSFQRQLNLYGFCRLTTGEDRGGYYHELFIRGRVDLCSRMVRTRVKGNGSKAASSPTTEPNFYRMEFCERPDGSGSCSGSSGSITDTEMFQRDEEEAIPISPAVSADALVSAVIDEDYPFEDCNNEFNDDKSAGGKTPPSILPESICSDDIGMALSESTPMLLDDTFGPLDRESTESLLDLKTAGSVPFVSPLVPSTKNVLDGSKFEMADAPTLDPFDSFFESQESIHSGDQLSFMGLPFHYLKSEDVIECLHQS
eukprot:CAMPEP_0113509968 /NCGR_PEP_ID=MMETSP0014_2-20120614/37869_1 /TAXON_ID=2857 /ORGANISM="Nitzschia sp." /LENGTH=606 /DNA_ID=CAMNT_0000405855 /DNA_START=291 /DNA_END=2111 /DNA_ORIENTATION=+ /assembly_acc=CAM_ASM_000159